MIRLRPKKPSRPARLPVALGLLSTVFLGGCVSSSIADLSLAGLQPNKPDPQLAVTQIKSNGESVPEVQVGEQTQSSSQVATAAPAVVAPETNSDGNKAAKRQPRLTLNATQGSIYAMAPPTPEETQEALQSGATVPAFVPLPTANPALASIYGDHAIQPASRSADPTQNKPLEKGGRIGTGQEQEVASYFPPAPSKPFNNHRFDSTAAPLQNPLAKKDGGRPHAKLNAFFPDRPAAPDLGGDDQEYDDQDEGLARLISAPGLARVAPNGIWIQTPYVETDCFKPNLIKLLHEIEKHFGKPPIVTSGYRSIIYNRRAGGVRHSEHTSCDAADIQIKGVSKWELAKYVRSLPDRGGVGTYCYTKSVHVDTGSERDWNWRCRRKKKRK